MKDPNLIYPGKDEDFVFPEEGSDMSMPETDGQLLQRLGTDAVKWAAEFRQTALRLGYSDMDEGWLIGWFANAIENAVAVRPAMVIGWAETRARIAELEAILKRYGLLYEEERARPRRWPPLPLKDKP